MPFCQPACSTLAESPSISAVACVMPVCVVSLKPETSIQPKNGVAPPVKPG
jgi:hypothetical protein